MSDPTEATAANAAIDILEAMVERGAVGDLKQLPGSMRALMAVMDDASREDPVVAEATGNMLRLMIGRGSVKTMEDVPASAARLRRALSGVVDGMSDPEPAPRAVAPEARVQAPARAPLQAKAPAPQEAEAAVASQPEAPSGEGRKLFGAAARAAEARLAREAEALQAGMAVQPHRQRSHKKRKEEEEVVAARAPGEPSPERIAANPNLRRPSETGQSPAVDPRKSITPDVIICLEDGKELTMLKRYIATHFDMTPEEYRWKWGLPPDFPMTAPNYSLQKSAYAKVQGLGSGALRPGMKGKVAETVDA